MPQTLENSTEFHKQTTSAPESGSQISDMVSSHQLGIELESLAHESLNGIFGPFRPASASTVRGPRSLGQLGPFWPNPMRSKGAKEGKHLAPKVRSVPNHNWTHLSQFWPRIPWTQIGPKFGHGPPCTIFQAMASDNHQRPPD
ncbi:hypothetical protein O181_071664 [Austropuccinia psidii MF-1]|uniref:Uncharacterized protein n=1 Tax=Austropuccinia psidii MF-1 TaxID=1389203 RepID=A0A9Q3F3N1_9BASI|nr:hypothetical protein [Austropuccinia psidii MF-1]